MPTTATTDPNLLFTMAAMRQKIFMANRVAIWAGGVVDDWIRFKPKEGNLDPRFIAAQCVCALLKLLLINVAFF